MKNLMRFGLCGFLTVFLSFAGLAVPGDEHWDNQFNLPGPVGNIAAIATHHGQLYVCGLASATNAPIQV